MPLFRRGRRWSPLLATVALTGASLAGVAVGATPALAASSPAQLAYTASSTNLQDLGRVNLATLAPTGSAGSSSGATPTPKAAQPLRRPVATGSHGKPISAGSFSIVKGNVAGEIGFNGVSGPAQAAANAVGGVPADLEPPDQGTCAGPGASGSPVTVDIINNALSVYSTTGTVEQGVTPTYALFNQPAGTFLSDPRCFYDAPTGRWFFTEFVVGSPAPSTQFVAVSTTSNPLGSYEVYGIDTTDVNNAFGDCPCFGDYDMIGADANGFYITTNEFSLVSSGFNGTVMYAISKQGIEAAAAGGTVPAVARYQITADAYGASSATSGNGPYHISPASTPAGGSYAPNTEYLVESNSDLAADNHLIVYALTGTNALASGGIPPLSATELTSEAYAFPPNATQKPGPTPQASANRASEGVLQADFNAVQETTYTNGQLYGELDTALGTTTQTDGIDWFDVAPSVAGATVSAAIVKQGYVANSENLLYPDLVLGPSGKGYLAFSMTGSAEYPSAAYVAFEGQPTGTIHLAAAGSAPEDGFTCLPTFGGACRWGDYSGGAYWGGRLYLMTEYIPSTPRDQFTNWGTFVWSVPAH